MRITRRASVTGKARGEAGESQAETQAICRRTADDQALVDAAHERRRERPLPYLVDTSDSQTRPDTDDMKLWTAKLQRALAAESGQAGLRQLVQLARIHGPTVPSGASALDINADVAAVAGIGPRDQLESLLAMQMVALHNLGMRALAEAANPQLTFDGQALCAGRASGSYVPIANTSRP